MNLNNMLYLTPYFQNIIIATYNRYKNYQGDNLRFGLPSP